MNICWKAKIGIQKICNDTMGERNSVENYGLE